MGPKKGHITSDEDTPKGRRSLPTRSSRPVRAAMRDGSDEDEVIAEVTTTPLERVLRESIRTAKKEAGLKSDDELPPPLRGPGPSTKSPQEPSTDPPKRKRGRPRKYPLPDQFVTDPSTSTVTPKSYSDSPKHPRATSTRIYYVGNLSDNATDADTESDGSGFRIFGRRTKRKKFKELERRTRLKSPDFQELLRKANSEVKLRDLEAAPVLQKIAPGKHLVQREPLNKRTSTGSTSSSKNKIGALTKKLMPTAQESVNVGARRFTRSFAYGYERRCSEESSGEELGNKKVTFKKTRLRATKSVTSEIYRKHSDSSDEHHVYPKRNLPLVSYDEVKRRKALRRKAETDVEKSDFDSDRGSLPNIRITPTQLTARGESRADDGTSDFSMPVLSRMTSPKEPEKEENVETASRLSAANSKRRGSSQINVSPIKKKLSLTKMNVEDINELSIRRTRSGSLPPQKANSGKAGRTLPGKSMLSDVSVSKKRSPDKSFFGGVNEMKTKRSSFLLNRKSDSHQSQKEEEESNESSEEGIRPRRQLPPVNYGPKRNKRRSSEIQNDPDDSDSEHDEKEEDEEESYSESENSPLIRSAQRSTKEIVQMRENRRKEELEKVKQYKKRRAAKPPTKSESESDESSVPAKRTRSKRKEEDAQHSDDNGSDPVSREQSDESESEPEEHIRARRNLEPVNYFSPQKRQIPDKAKQKKSESESCSETESPTRRLRSRQNFPQTSGQQQRSTKNVGNKTRSSDDSDDNRRGRLRSRQQKEASSSESSAPEKNPKTKKLRQRVDSPVGSESFEFEKKASSNKKSPSKKQRNQVLIFPQRGSTSDEYEQDSEDGRPRRKERNLVTLPSNPRRPQSSIGTNNYFSSSSEEDERFNSSIMQQAQELVKGVYEPIIEENRKEMAVELKRLQKHLRFLPKKEYKTLTGEKPEPFVLDAEEVGEDVEVVRPAGPPVPVHYIPTTPAYPRMKHWVYIEQNIKTEDSLRLSHIPYIDDEHDSVAFVRDLKKAYPEGIHGTLQGWGKHISDYLLYRLLKEVLPKWHDTKHDMSYVYTAIYRLFPNKMSARQLGTIYPILEQRFVATLKQLNQPRSDDIGHSIRTMMCVKCLQYHCLLHGVSGEPFRMHRKPKNEQDKPTYPCSKDCYLYLTEVKVENESSDEEEPVFHKKANLKIKPRPFTKRAEQKFRKLQQINRFTVCQITAMMAFTEKRTCQEVYYLLKRPIRPDRELSPDDIMKRRLSMKEVQSSFRHFTWSLGGGHVDNSEQPHACKHKGPCGKKVKECICAQRDTLCSKFCCCGVDCKMRFPGCRCQPGQCRTKQCQCFYAKWECDPDVCKNCNCGPYVQETEAPEDIEIPLAEDVPFDEEDGNKEWPDFDHPSKKREEEKIPTCCNVNMQRGNYKKLKVGKSDIAGYGCFIDEHCEKGEFIAEYTGEVISKWEAERRGRIYDEYKTSYIFALNKEQSVDATRMGNHIRFANHSDKDANCYSQIIMVNGEHRIGIFAKRKLWPREELLFDYQYNKKWKAQYCPNERNTHKEGETSGSEP